jgi:hypothetical protein
VAAWRDGESSPGAPFRAPRRLCSALAARAANSSQPNKEERTWLCSLEQSGATTLRF